MNCFIVMQGDTYHEEKDACVIWSPKEDISGNEPHSWKRLKEVHAGDQLFHYVRGNIVAVSIAKKDCQEAPKPSRLLNHHKSNDGYLVELEYHELDKPVNVKSHFHEIYPLLPFKYAPFQNDSNGNPGYLYPCNEELAIKLLELISESNFYRVNEEQLELTIDEVRKIERNTLVPLITEIESEAKTKMRWGEAKFRKDLMPLWEDKCAICSINLAELLKASRSKPWKDSTNQERLDPYNGLLLCRNHDALYHEGLIAFDGQGRLHISSVIHDEAYEMYGLKPHAKIQIHSENKVYLKWHKRNIFSKDDENELS